MIVRLGQQRPTYALVLDETSDSLSVLNPCLMSFEDGQVRCHSLLRSTKPARLLKSSIEWIVPAEDAYKYYYYKYFLSCSQDILSNLRPVLLQNMEHFVAEGSDAYSAALAETSRLQEQANVAGRQQLAHSREEAEDDDSNVLYQEAYQRPKVH